MTPREITVLYFLIFGAIMFVVGVLLGLHIAPGGYDCGQNDIGAWCHRK